MYMSINREKEEKKLQPLRQGSGAYKQSLVSLAINASWYGKEVKAGVANQWAADVTCYCCGQLSKTIGARAAPTEKARKPVGARAAPTEKARAGNCLVVKPCRSSAGHVRTWIGPCCRGVAAV